ncbi:MAG: hypothetical protein KDB88_05005 [Flavobacteriales bacterium]|nr:hypothetical protein [Flavobacteriales bacterium]
MNSRLPSGPSDRLLLEHRPMELPYVAKPEWEFSLMGGYFSLDRRWRGSDAVLAEKREQAEATGGAWLYGAAFGRRWPHGAYLGLGVQHGGSAGAFNYRNTFTSTTVETVPIVAVFDNSVLYNSVDTTILSIARSEDIQDRNRTSIWRIPLSAGWHGSFGRWRIGVNLELAYEAHRMAIGHILARSGPDGSVVAVSSDAREGVDAVSVLAIGGGLEVGRQLSQGFCLSVAPTFSRGAWRLGPERSAEYLPSLFGVNMRLHYTLFSREK